jgi:hypothetical protein
LNETYALRAPHIRRPNKMALGGTAAAYQSFELYAGDDVFVPGVAILGQSGGVEYLKTGGDNNRAHIELEGLVTHIEIDAILVTHIPAFATGDGVVTETLLRVDQIG